MLSANVTEVEPDAAALQAAHRAAEARGPVVPLLTAEDVRRDRAARTVKTLDGRAQEREIPGVAGPVTLRVIAPDRPARAVRVTAHASGWCLGDATLDDAVGGALATSADVASVAVEYRLAPEHPFPAGLDDVMSALIWAAERGGDEFGTDRVIAAGGSAGSHLTMLALLRLRDERPDVLARIAAVDLRYGCYDLGQTPSLRAAGAGATITTSAGTAALLNHFLPGVDDELRREPSLSPLYADLHGLPPTLLAVGERDGLLDDSAFLAARLAAAGVTTELQIWRGCTHVFDTLSPALGADFSARLEAWLERWL